MTGQWVYNAFPEVDAESQYPTILGVSITICAMMVLVVSTRLYVRARMLKFLGADDFVIVASAVSFTLSTSLKFLLTALFLAAGLQYHLQCSYCHAYVNFTLDLLYHL